MYIYLLLIGQHIECSILSSALWIHAPSINSSAIPLDMPRFLCWTFCFQLAKREREIGGISRATLLHIPICQNPVTRPQSTCKGSLDMKCSSASKKRKQRWWHPDNLPRFSLLYTQFCRLRMPSCWSQVTHTGQQKETSCRASRFGFESQLNSCLLALDLGQVP